MIARMIVVTVLSVGAIASPASGAATTLPAECAAVQGKIERLEGRLTPNACAFLKRQIAFGEMTTGTPPEPGSTTHPRVQAYLEIFDKDASLWEAGSAPTYGMPAIESSIIGSLRLIPDLRYRATEVVSEGAVMMFGQWNEFTLQGHKVAYPQIARNVLSDDGKTIQARRYYDRYTWFKPIAPDLENMFAGVSDSGAEQGRRPAPFQPSEMTARLRAWNNEDAGSLVARMGNMPLTAPGLSRPLTTKAGKLAYLQRLFDRADVKFKPGQTAFGKTMTYTEWHGSATTDKGTDVPFGIVERFGPGGEWELVFDTLPLVKTSEEIRELYSKAAQKP